MGSVFRSSVWLGHHNKWTAWPPMGNSCQFSSPRTQRRVASLGIEPLIGSHMSYCHNAICHISSFIPTFLKKQQLKTCSLLGYWQDNAKLLFPHIDNWSLFLIQVIPEQEENVVLVPCRICRRKFRTERIDKHVSVCAKSSTKKRKVFNMSKARKKGTDLEKFTFTKGLSSRQSQPQPRVR